MAKKFPLIAPPFAAALLPPFSVVREIEGESGGRVSISKWKVWGRSFEGGTGISNSKEGLLPSANILIYILY